MQVLYHGVCQHQALAPCRQPVRSTVACDIAVAAVNGGAVVAVGVVVSVVVGVVEGLVLAGPIVVHG
jgi:hypothetical protein